jgi:serine/threonine protein kinase
MPRCVSLSTPVCSFSMACRPMGTAPLRKDEEFVLYRGERSNQAGTTSFLLLAPASTRPALETLRKIEHEYSLRDELVNSGTGEVRLMGFGIASRLPRERQSPEPPEFVAGTLPYMAPEQTGTNESLYRFSQRSLLSGRHAVRNADRQSPFHRFRSNGMGALPYRKTASSARRTGAKYSRPGLGPRYEVTRQNR